MAPYSIAGKSFYFSCAIQDLFLFRSIEKVVIDINIHPTLALLNLLCQTTGWVGEATRLIEIWAIPSGILLKVEGSSDFYISQDGQAILRVDKAQRKVVGGGVEPPSALSALDREIILGPVLVLALALRGTWSLHASASMFQEKVIVFLGESGQGKSTLAAYLSQNAGWRSVADDILPVTFDPSGVIVWPRFPQLKLPPESQPWIGLPEQLPLGAVCVIESATPDQEPELHKLTVPQAAQAFIGHIAGTRMFPPDLLKKHLEFSAQAAAQVPVYRLVYPHRRDILPTVKTLLENIR